jgi:hypothetical protein
MGEVPVKITKVSKRKLPEGELLARGRKKANTFPYVNAFCGKVIAV